ncbi:MAG: L,D-transpeptidase, partial [Pseudonocardiaceae bacterium]
PADMALPGRDRKGGHLSPPGRFWIREKFKVKNPGGPYGPRAFGTSDYSRLSDWPGGGVIGIHGTNAPYLIPGRPSHGCIRVPNHAIARLYRLMPIGTPMRIHADSARADDHRQRLA